MIAVFARPNHPRYVDHLGAESTEWRYHGYVVVFVHCVTVGEIDEVVDKLRVDGLPEPFGHDYEQGWYGGKMDLLTVLPGEGPYADSNWWFSPVRIERERASIGDNRYAGFYEAAEILSGDDGLESIATTRD